MGDLDGMAGHGAETAGEGDRRHGAEHPVDLVADDGGDAEALAQSDDLGGVGEPGARDLDADRLGVAVEQGAGDAAEGDGRLVADHRDGARAHDAAPAEDVVGGIGLLEHGDAEVVEPTGGDDRRVRVPPAVGVGVELDVVAQLGPQRPHRGHVDAELAPHLDLERVDAVLVAHLDGVGDHLGGRPEPDHVRGAHVVGRVAQQHVHRLPARLADKVPQGDVDRSAGALLATVLARPARIRSRANGSAPTSTGVNRSRTAATIEVAVSP